MKPDRGLPQKIGVTRIHRSLDDTFTDRFNVRFGTFTCQEHSYRPLWSSGTVSLSTTVIHGVAGIDVKLFGGCRNFLIRHRLRKSRH